MAFQKREEHQVVRKEGGSAPQGNHPLCQISLVEAG